MAANFKPSHSTYEHPSNAPIEDTTVFEQTDTYIFAGVFDGHAGDQCSHFLRREFLNIFKKHLASKKDVSKALKIAFKDADEQYISRARKGNPVREGLYAGSCAVVVYVDLKDKTVYCGNLGDSRAVLGQVDKTGWAQAMPLSTDHSAGTGSERHRARMLHPRDENIVVEDWDEYLDIYVYLVKNCCMFTRSVGDAYMKIPEVSMMYNQLVDDRHKIKPLPSKDRPFILNEAEVTVHKMNEHDHYIIVACDGLWDEMTNDEAVTRVHRYTTQLKGPKEKTSEHLVMFALEKAAQRLNRKDPSLQVETLQDLLAIPPGREGRKYLHDDISVVVIRLPPAEAVAAGQAIPMSAEKRPSKWDVVRKAIGEYGSRILGKGLRRYTKFCLFISLVLRGGRRRLNIQAPLRFRRDESEGKGSLSRWAFVL
mmetsp:Transcript_20937/g.54072  ORF Transcript_20937/g.54072 Transcript_20937/m.54072 type:complete len:424 (+) Transcript_20937:19-1290(+)